MPDNRYILQRRRSWYVRVRVPEGLIATVGQTHIVRSLKTRDASTARHRRWLAMGDIHRWFAQVQADGKAIELERELRLVAPVAAKGTTGTPAADDEIHQAAIGAVTGARAHLGSAEGRGATLGAKRITLPSTARMATQRTLVRKASGDSRALGGTAERAAVSTTRERKQTAHEGTAARSQQVPTALPNDPSLSELAERWLKEVGPNLAQQTVGHHRVALREFFAFTGGTSRPEDVTRRMAGRFISEHLLLSDRSKRTVNRLISSLSAFWTWLMRRGYVETNPWHGQFERKSAADRSTKRAYSDRELQALLAADATASIGNLYGSAINDLLRLGLMTGARLNELCELRVEDIAENAQAIRIRGGKTDNARRVVPLHPLVQPIVRRRLAAAKDGQLFPELRPGGPDHKRSWYVSKSFTRFRRRVLGDDRTVDFHSLRRCFATLLERASTLGPDVNASVIAELMGHSKPTLALSLYSAGLSAQQLERAISSLDTALASETREVLGRTTGLPKDSQTQGTSGID